MCFLSVNWTFLWFLFPLSIFSPTAVTKQFQTSSHPPLHTVSWTPCLPVMLLASVYSHLNRDSLQLPIQTYVWVRILLSSHSQSRPLPLCRPLHRFSLSTTTPPQPALPHRPPRWPLERGPRAPGSRSRWPGRRSATESQPSLLVQPHQRESKISSTWSRECSQILPEAVLKPNYTSNRISRQSGSW